MNQYSELLVESQRARPEGYRFRPVALILVPLSAILFQVYVPLFFDYLRFLALPLLVTVYFALMRRNAVGGMLYGAVIGLVQDSLSHHPLGMFGIVKTLVGYFAASVSVRFDVDNPVMRLILAFFFFLFHQAFYWTLARALLGQTLDFNLRQTLLFGAMNAVISVPLFHVFDKLKTRG
ncbi:MAG: rod shape-determining protein MreD [bacterium]|nr:rod shape-determining protein MreD [bacterium]